MPEREITWSKEKLLLRAIYLGLVVVAIFLSKAVIDQVLVRVLALSVLFSLVLFCWKLFKDSPKWSAQLFILCAYLGLNIAIATHGGFNSMGMTALFFPAVMALLLIGAKAGHIWVVVCLVTILGYFVFNLLGVTFPVLTQVKDMNVHHLLGLLVLTISSYLLGFSLYRLSLMYSLKLQQKILQLKAEGERRKLAEASANQASNAKSFFLANMTHEIRTPLNGIVGIVDLLNDTNLDSQQKEYIRTLNEASHLLLEQVNDILDFSKIESGEFELHNSVFSVMECISGLVSLFSLSAHHKGLKFTCEISQDMPQGVYSDEKCLRQVFSNLISNAIKYTHEGGIHVNIDYVDNELIFSCKDTGLGITKRAQKQLFEPFTQDSTDETQFIQGTGLGLSITKSLCEIMHGHINVVSEIHKGSTFTATIPMDEARLSKTPESIHEHEKDVINKLHVLVVEDNLVNQIVLKGLLKKIDCTFDVCDDGVQAMEYLRSHKHPDVVMSDIQMPNMNGYELIKAIREDETLKDLHVLALTATATVEEHMKTEQAGFDGFFTKPIERTKVVDYFSKFND
jgi:signal transduction histidine kinase/ActR/RegA family two-component response regulator